MSSVGERLTALAAGSTVLVTDELAAAATAHHELMLRWNQVHNLTRVVDVEDVARLHWLDCLLAAAALQEQLVGGREDADHGGGDHGAVSADRVLDVGTGAGFPGVCIACAWPSSQLTLLEPARKRVSFLQRARAALGLENVTVREARLEDLAEGETWDGVVTRATFQPDQLGRLANVIAPGGWMGALVGDASAESWRSAASEAGLEGADVLPYALPGAEKRAVLFARKPS